MPAPGDQHRDTAASVNPFLTEKPHIAEYTAQQIATLQSRLDKQLGPEYISTRPGNGGGKVHYLAAEKVINLANEVFGFNGWSSQIQNVQIDFVDENATNGRISLGLSTIVRVSLKDGTFHEDIGYGHCENTKGKAAAFEKAKKEAATDAMKRALRNFGNVLGNCLYDKDYLQRITKVKVAPSKWDAENLHRHPDYAPIKKEVGVEAATFRKQGTAVQRNTSLQSEQSAASHGSAEFEDDFGGNLFDETDFTHPDEVRLDDTAVSSGPQSPTRRPANLAPQQNGIRQGVTRTDTPQMRPPNIQHPPPIQSVQTPQRPQSIQRPQMNAGQHATGMLPPQTAGNFQRPQPMTNGQQQQNQAGNRSNPSSGTASDPNGGQMQQRQSNPANLQPQQGMPERDEQGFPIEREPPPGVPLGFVTGRKASLLNNASESKPLTDIAFNPHAESPSIRRTPGINQGKSAPVNRMAISGGNMNTPSVPTGGPGFQAAAINGHNGAPRPTGANFVNPSADMNRKIGMPQAGGFPRGNGYKPPTVMKRSAMADVTNVQQMDGPPNAKRAKVDGVAPAGGENQGEQPGVVT